MVNLIRISVHEYYESECYLRMVIESNVINNATGSKSTKVLRPSLIQKREYLVDGNMFSTPKARPDRSF
jgi:hypothetical protein